MLDIDLSNPVNKVRAIIGDWDSLWVSDGIIQHFLDENNNEIILAASDTLDIIISHAANFVREEVGDVEIYWRDLYEQLSDRKRDLQKDVLYKKTTALFSFGGTSKSEVRRVKSSSESTSLSLTNQEFEKLLKRMDCLPTDSAYRLCW